MRFLTIPAVFLMGVLMASCNNEAKPVTSAASGEVLTNIRARATGGGTPFRGEARQLSDLEDLAATAYGVEGLGLHRGHAPIEEVLSEFLGITHRQMHTLMDKGQNLAATCEYLGFAPENLVETLTNSFTPFIEEAATNGVIPAAEIPQWRGRIREQFRRRVYWEG